VAAFGCGDERQALVWLMRTDALSAAGMIRTDAPSLEVPITVPGLQPGRYSVTLYDTGAGAVVSSSELHAQGGILHAPAIALTQDVAIAIRSL
jgi:mannan endo-1,4-beta-mannosidase